MVKDLEKEFLEVMLESRRIYLEGDIYGDTVQKIEKMIIGLNAKDEREILLYINSGGGSVRTGFDLYDIIKHSKAPVIGMVVGRADSMAGIILQACHLRRALSHSTFYLHYSQINLCKEWNEFAAEAEKIIKGAETNQEEIWKIFAQRGIDIEKIKKLCSEKKNLSAQEAKELGLIDEII